MKKSKFFISMFTLLILLTGGPFQSTVNAQAISISNDIRPYYSYVSNINAFISIDNGYATCLGSLSIYYDYPTSITITPPLLTSSYDSLLSTNYALEYAINQILMNILIIPL